MVGPNTPQFVLFGSSIVQFSFGNGGWASSLFSRNVGCWDRNLLYRVLLQVKTALVNYEKVLPYWSLPEVLTGAKLLESQFDDDYGCSDSSEMLGWDSIDRCKQLLDKVDIVLRGYAWWNSRRALEVLDDVFPKDSTVQPALVIVYFSGNDSMRAHPSGLGSYAPLPEYVENMGKIAAHVKNLSEKTRVILLTASPSNKDRILKVFGGVSSDLGRTNELCKIYSDACLKLCEEMNIKVIDLRTAIQRKADWQTTCFTDGIHFSTEGSKIVAEEILTVIKESY